MFIALKPTMSTASQKSLPCWRPRITSSPGPELQSPDHEGGLLGLEEQDGAVAEVEIDEVFGLVGDEGAEVSADDAVPGWALSLIELERIRSCPCGRGGVAPYGLLDVLCDVLERR